MIPSAEAFIRTFRAAALQAGAVAARLQGKVVAERKEAHGTAESEALTAVDLATQDVLLLRLHEDFPAIAVDAEEDTDTARLFPPADPARALVIVDPVDGTLNYIRRSPDYAVMGALVVAGEYRAALLHFPAHGATAWAIRGQGCFVQRAGQAPARVVTPSPPDELLVSPRTAAAWREALAPLATHVTVSRCSAVDSTAPALGRARAAVAARGADRRRAVGFLLTLEVGGVVRCGGVDWQGADPGPGAGLPGPCIVASDAALADRIEATLAARPAD